LVKVTERIAAGQHPRLAGARAGQHQHRSIQRFHRLALLGIEACEILRRGGRACARSNTASRGLVLGDAGMGQSVRLGHANRLNPHDGTVGR
jgi:hypothetical protein